jgi:hypothetical protein
VAKKIDPVGDGRAALARSGSVKPTFGQCADQFIALNVCLREVVVATALYAAPRQGSIYSQS